MSDPHDLGMTRRNGFLMLEILVVLMIISLLAMLSLPGTWNMERHQLEVVTREIALEIQGIRQHAVANNGGKDAARRLALRPDGYKLYVSGHVQKYCPYHYGVHLLSNDPGKDFRFDDEGRPKQDTHVILQSKSGAYERKIVIAVQTGRIRIE